MKHSKKGSRAPLISNFQQGDQQENHRHNTTFVESIDPEPPAMEIIYTNGNLKDSLSSEHLTAHDWVMERQKLVYDDGTITFFWRAHTLTVLFFLTGVLVYIAFFDNPLIGDSDLNAKRGLIAVTLVFLLFGVTQTPDGPFKRPHPALWRFVFCCSIIYELGLIFMLFQTVTDARRYLQEFDSSLGRPLSEKDYGGNCRIYDAEVPPGTSAFHNVWDKLDVFVTIHFFGWWLKTLMLRDYWLCTVISVMFELLEYSLEHQLPNFSECWWDHWIMDVLVCNGLGIYFGMRTLKYLKMKQYNWRGMWAIPSFKGKVKRVAQQFTPYSWMEYNWKPMQSFTRWMAMLGVIFAFLLGELNWFYLKFVFWVPPSHWLNIIRLVLFLGAGAVSMRETFQYLDDPTVKEFGRQSWVVLAIVITEFLIIVKFGWSIITKPLPSVVLVFWSCAFVGLFSWTMYNFFIQPYFSRTSSDSRVHTRTNSECSSTTSTGLQVADLKKKT